MRTIVIGSLNTDLIARGIKKFPKAGELVYGKELIIGPGGKSRNIADMIARLSPEGSVAMLGRTVRDPYGLWRAPVDELGKAGVDTSHLNIVDYDQVMKLPGIALIPVDEEGNNQIFVLPGVSDDFSIEDVDRAKDLFEKVGSNQGSMVLTMECPLSTAAHAVKMVNQYGLKVMFDPGGVEKDTDLSELISESVYLMKPNEHEAKMLTGIDVTDLESAQKAADKLQQLGIENILITVGSSGAYLFGKDLREHIPVQEIKAVSERDETGCGDQTMAALIAHIQDGKSLQEAAALAVRAGTLQFYRVGIDPLTKADLEENID